MATVKLNTKGKTIAEKLTLTQTVITDSTNNPSLPDPNPATVVTLNAKRYALQVALASSSVAKAAMKTATQVLNAAEDELDTAVAQHGAYVQDETKGVAAAITSTGFGVADESNAPIVPTAPADFSATPGDEPGEISGHWNPQNGRPMFEMQVTLDLTGASGWGNSEFTRRSKNDVQGLTPGALYLVRVRAIGADEKGPWSQSVQCRAA